MRHDGSMIDWDVARRVARMTAGDVPSPVKLPGDLSAIAADAQRRVTEYSEISPAQALPEPESVDREEWVALNLASMAPLLEPVTERVGSGLGPLAGPVRAGMGMVMAAQVGALTGYLSQRVLGQYEAALLNPQAPRRLIFVVPNLHHAARQLDADPETLLKWVAFHETTHAVQFAGVPWLREHISGLVNELVASIDVKFDTAELLRLPSSDDLRAMVAALRKGDVITLLAGPERRELLDRMQATMAVVEGHAEHVMDAVGADVLPALERLRSALERRRRTRPPLMRVLDRLLGMDMKMRQYDIGKRFCDRVVAADGIAGLNRLWDGPDALPTLAELEDPPAWRARMRVAPAAA